MHWLGSCACESALSWYLSGGAAWLCVPRQIGEYAVRRAQQLFPLFGKEGHHQLYDIGGFCNEPDAIAFQTHRGFHLTAEFRDLAICLDE
jgi:hypothetical protein